MKETVQNFGKDRFISPAKRSLRYDKETGKLYRFDKISIKVVRLGKPYPAAYIKSEDNSYWKHYVPESGFPFLFRKPNKDELANEDEEYRYFAEFKLKVYDVLVQFIGEDRYKLLSRFSSRGWFLYCFLFNCGQYAFDLTSSNPALGYLISAHAVFHPLKSKQYWRSVRYLVLKKRKDILSYFGFPAKESAVTLLSKLDIQACDNTVLLSLRKALNNNPELLRKLSFYSKHNKASLSIYLSNLSELFHHQLVEKIARNNLGTNKRYFFLKVYDILRMKQTLEENNIRTRKPYFRTRFDVDIIHDELVRSLMTKNIKRDYTVYPECHLEDVVTDSIHIETIKNSDMLYLEGLDMNHCIYSYHRLLVKGVYYVAKMLAPERITICFERYLTGFLLIDVRGYKNSLPKEESVKLIRKWLKNIYRYKELPIQLTLFDDFQQDYLKEDTIY